MLRGVRRSIIQGSARVDVSKSAVRAVASYYQPFSVRNYHQSSKVENELIVGGLAIGTAALTLQYAARAYEAYAQKRAETPGAQQTEQKEGQEVNEATTKASETANADESQGSDAAAAQAEKREASKQRAKATAANVDAWFGSWNTWFAKNFYDGGFEEKMTKREAALILGVRESASPERIKEAHRKIMQINHPDKGGSAYLTAKVNEAKDMLLKGKQ